MKAHTVVGRGEKSLFSDPASDPTPTEGDGERKVPRPDPTRDIPSISSNDQTRTATLRNPPDPAYGSDRDPWKALLFFFDNMVRYAPTLGDGVTHRIFISVHPFRQ